MGFLYDFLLPSSPSFALLYLPRQASFASGVGSFMEPDLAYDGTHRSIAQGHSTERRTKESYVDAHARPPLCEVHIFLRYYSLRSAPARLSAWIGDSSL